MRPLHRTLESMDRLEIDRPYASALAAGVLHFATGAVITHLGDRLGISLRHGHSDSARRRTVFAQHPILSAVGITTVIPVAEELFWRAAPAHLADRFPKQPRLQRAITLGALSLFALQHAGPDGIPVNQAIGGVLYQHLYDTNGILASTLAHSTNNGLAALTYALSQRTNKSKG